MSLLNFSINGKSTSATRYEGTARQFSIVVDEPATLGGEDSAANPVEYILGANKQKALKFHGIYLRY